MSLHSPVSLYEVVAPQVLGQPQDVRRLVAQTGEQKLAEQKRAFDLVGVLSWN